MTWIWVIPVIVALAFWAPKELGKERWWLAGAAIGFVILQSLTPLAAAFIPGRMTIPAVHMNPAPLIAPARPEGGQAPGPGVEPRAQRAPGSALAPPGQRGVWPQPGPRPFSVRPYRAWSPVWWVILGLLLGLVGARLLQRWPLTALGLPGVYLKLRLVRGEITPEEYDSLRHRLSN